ncbi:MAG: 2Fe-2S iron-sulfur cluster-binding protein [Acidobacteriota bacterium]
MTRVKLTVNGTAVAAEVEPRTHLADFLREHLLLTGTHIGCEHGICGACTVLIDGEPARSCIAFAADCEGRDVRSIEGLDTDGVMAALRDAFSAEHALQCGYCTPGMLVTARDIVLRLPDADDERIRLELAGNLCRCTGYSGIVRAIRRVLDRRSEIAVPAVPQPSRQIAAATDTVMRESVAAAVAKPAQGEVAAGVPAAGSPLNRLQQTLRIGLPRDVVWKAVQDPASIAACVPGARLISIQDGRIQGEMLAALGPIRARFKGDAVLSYDSANFAGKLVGEGRDSTSGTRLSGEAAFRVIADGPEASAIELTVTYALRGSLAQFGRGPIVQVFAREIADTVGRNLEARLCGRTEPVATRLGTGRLALRAALHWLRDLFRWIFPR